MIDLVSVKNMRNSDAFTIAHSTPSLELMRRAGLVLFKALHYKGNINIVVGKGNNGGDGFALACFLADAGFSPVIYRLFYENSDDSFYFEMQCKKKGVIINDYVPGLGQLDDADIIVDCLLGTGFHGEAEGVVQDCIEEINSYENAYVVSCDINSGMSGDTGSSSLVVKSDLTVTIGYLKKGMLYSRNDIKTLVIGDIGIKLAEEEDKLLTMEEYLRVEGPEYEDHGLKYKDNGNGKMYLAPEGTKIHFVSYKD